MASRGGIVALGLAAAGLLLAADVSSKSRAGKKGLPPGLDELPPPMEAGQELLRYLAEWAFLDEAWIAFFEVTAWRESKFNNMRGLGKPSLFPDWAQPNVSASKKVQNTEAAAAVKAYTRNDYLRDCPWPAQRYSFGSGGWFGLLPPNAVYAFKDTRYECIDPWSVFDPVPSLVMAIEYARRTMRRSGFKKKPTFLNLRVGWWSPANMGKQDKMNAVAQNFGDQLEELGVPAHFMHQEVTDLPPDMPADLLDALAEVI